MEINRVALSQCRLKKTSDVRRWQHALFAATSVMDQDGEITNQISTWFLGKKMAGCPYDIPSKTHNPHWEDAISHRNVLFPNPFRASNSLVESRKFGVFLCISYDFKWIILVIPWHSRKMSQTLERSWKTHFGHPGNVQRLPNILAARLCLIPLRLISKYTSACHGIVYGDDGMSTISGVHRRHGESEVGHLQNDINTRGKCRCHSSHKACFICSP